MVTVFCLVLFSWLLPVASAGVSSLYRNYSIVLVGGGLQDNNTEVWSTIIDLAGGKGVARFGVISGTNQLLHIV